jgi:hypothetical protein
MEMKLHELLIELNKDLIELVCFPKKADIIIKRILNKIKKYEH